MCSPTTPRSGLVTPGGRIVTGPLAIIGEQFDPAGRVVAFDPGVFAGPTTQIGGSGQAFPPDRTLITGGRSTRAFGHLGYDIGDRISLAVEGLWSDNSARVVSGTNFVTAPIFADNAFLRPELGALLADPREPAAGLRSGLGIRLRRRRAGGLLHGTRGLRSDRPVEPARRP